MNRAQTQFQCDTLSLVRFDHPSETPHIDPREEVSEANFLPPTQKAGNPAWEYCSTSDVPVLVRRD
jgi:hypothetical protein